MSTLLELAERCEKAAGPDDGTLDRLIFNAIGGSGDPIDPWGGFRSYTVSVDAAMTLVPDGHVMAVTNCGTDDARGPDWTKASAIVGKEQDDATSPTTASTPALALCAAALKARAASGMEARQGGNEVPCEARQPDGEAETPKV